MSFISVDTPCPLPPKRLCQKQYVAVRRGISIIHAFAIMHVMKTVYYIPPGNESSRNLTGWDVAGRVKILAAVGSTSDVPLVHARRAAVVRGRRSRGDVSHHRGGDEVHVDGAAARAAAHSAALDRVRVVCFRIAVVINFPRLEQMWNGGNKGGVRHATVCTHSTRATLLASAAW